MYRTRRRRGVAYSTETMAKEVKISHYKQSVLVTGGTYNIKGTLKALGGSWNKTLGGWVFRKRDRDKVISGLRPLPGINVIDQTVASAAGMAAAVVTPTKKSPAVTASASAKPDDFSDLALLPTPNKGKFEHGVPGEWLRIGSSVSQHTLGNIASFMESGRTIALTPHGNIYEAKSRRQKEEQRRSKAEEDEGLPAEGYLPKNSVEGSRTRSGKRMGNFVCDGTLYRHTAVSWKDAPVEFKHAHRVEATKESPVRSFRYEHKIEDLLPFDRSVYWKTIWEKCDSCHRADDEFSLWAMRASTPGAIAASKKRKAEEVAAAEEPEGQGKPKACKGSLKSE
ncbi:hypothetical protein ACHAWF_013774 [Thalassiosira exigua]